MPPRGVKSAKRARQYEHIKDSEKKQGRSTRRAKQIAAATVNKQRRKAGETKTSRKRSSSTRKSSGAGSRKSSSAGSRKTSTRKSSGSRKAPSRKSTGGSRKSSSRKKR
jgi:hypothetical protein